MAGLRGLGIYDDVAVFLLADHGESLTEHDLYFDHPGLYEPTIHIPLVVKLPGGAGAGRVVPGMVTQMDVAPTILDLFGAEIPGHLDGKSLLPLADGRADRTAEVVYLCEGVWEAKWGLRTDEWKLILNVDKGLHSRDHHELYNLRDDPRETHNLWDERPEVRDRLQLQFVRWQEAQLGHRPDPLRVVCEKGLPTWGTLKESLARDGKTLEQWQAELARLRAEPNAL
jgi:arylsulfatase